MNPKVKDARCQERICAGIEDFIDPAAANSSYTKQIVVDGKSVKNADELEKLLAAAKPGSVLLARVRRGEASRFAPIPIPKPN